VSYRSLALLAGVAVGLAGTVCGGAQSASRDPAQVVKAFFDAVNAGQVDKAMSYVSSKYSTSQSARSPVEQRSAGWFSVR
jgi:hypothetical protein